MKRTCLVYLLTFSLALNAAAVATLVFSWWKGQAKASQVSFGQKSLKRFLREDLNLMNEQSDRLLQHTDQSKTKVTKLRGLLDSNLSEMMAIICTSPIDPTSLEARVKEINHTQSQIRLIAVGMTVSTRPRAS